MDYCGPHGIPHSHFLGGPRVWTEEDQQKALWWMVRERQRCSGCGTHPDDWNEDLGGRRDAFVAEERTCPGCRERGPAEQLLQKEQHSGPAKHGARIVLVRPPDDDGGD